MQTPARNPIRKDRDMETSREACEDENPGFATGPHVFQLDFSLLLSFSGAG